VVPCGNEVPAEIENDTSKSVPPSPLVSVVVLFHLKTSLKNGDALGADIDIGTQPLLA